MKSLDVYIWECLQIISLNQHGSTKTICVCYVTNLYLYKHKWPRTNKCAHHVLNVTVPKQVSLIHLHRSCLFIESDPSRRASSWVLFGQDEEIPGSTSNIIRCVNKQTIYYIIYYYVIVYCQLKINICIKIWKHLLFMYCIYKHTPFRIRDQPVSSLLILGPNNSRQQKKGVNFSDLPTDIEACIMA